MSLYQAAFVVSCLEVQIETENPEGSNKFHTINFLQMCLLFIELRPFCLLNEKKYFLFDTHFTCARRGLDFILLET